ncbi:MAG: hypothetical protein IPI67_41900 [Myxococcales bacterium]|nr:hypothetical protein [Myxococcales bacterium]
MSYREPTEALRAELEHATSELESARAVAKRAEQKLARAETALSALRAGASPLEEQGNAAARAAQIIALLSWMASVILVMQDHDAAGGYVAAAAAALAAFGPLVAWASTGQTLMGVGAVVGKILVAIFVAAWITSRRHGLDDSWKVLFWVGPATLVLLAVAECALLIRSDPSR